VFRRQIQLAINEGHLMFHEMQVDKQPFPINTMELQQPKVLVRPHQAEATRGKNVMVGEAKPDLRGKELTREVAYEKTSDGRETFKITVKASEHGGQGSSTPSGQQTTGITQNHSTSMGGTHSKVEGEDRHDLEPKGTREDTRHEIYTGSGSRSSYPTSCLG
jgi:hypothetical protein